MPPPTAPAPAIGMIPGYGFAPTYGGPSRGHKPPSAPPTYDVKQTYQGHANWVAKCESIFKLSPNSFQTDEEKILWCAQGLKDKYMTSWYQTGSLSGNVNTWNEFTEYLLNLTSDPESRSLYSAQRYLEARQSATQTAQEFDTHLSNLEGQLPQMTEEWRALGFILRLKPELQKSIRATG